VILLRAKQIDFKVTYIDLTAKPDWFLKISPHGKVPVLVVDEQPLFESNAIAEYLDEMVDPQLHPQDAILRARHRAWTDFVPEFARSLSAIYYSKSAEDSHTARQRAQSRLQKIEDALTMDRAAEGPYFGGHKLCLVDAAYAPFLQRFFIVEKYLKSGLLDAFPALQKWARDLIANEFIQTSVVEDFEERFTSNLRRRGFKLEVSAAAV